MEINPQNSIFHLYRLKNVSLQMLSNMYDEGHITYLEPTFYLAPRVSTYSNAS